MRPRERYSTVGHSVQRITKSSGSRGFTLDLPAQTAEVLPGVRWGSPAEFFTPAYWKAQSWFTVIAGRRSASHAVGDTLREEVAVCLLGGFGIPAEVGLAAFEHLRSRGILKRNSCPGEGEIRRALDQPLTVGNRCIRYRFARQKSRYLAAILEALDHSSPPTKCHLAFRRFFLSLPGFGPKTASWLTRNWLNSDRVAVLDVHIRRAGVIAGIFSQNHVVSRHYDEMEERFLRFAHRIDVRPSILDAVMWRDMRKGGAFARDLVENME